MSNNTVVGDFKVCKEAANQFYYVAKWCLDRDAVDYLINTFYPCSVNISFACELYLKAIMIYRSTTDAFFKGHNLKELFNNLESLDNQSITSKFASKYNNKSIIDFLEENKTVFVDWRYALEKQVEIDLTGFMIFADTLRDYVESLGGTTT